MNAHVFRCKAGSANAKERRIRLMCHCFRLQSTVINTIINNTSLPSSTPALSSSTQYCHHNHYHQGVLPPAQKRSILIPVIKHEGLDPTDPGNFRPIANVSFLSKVVEKIIAYQLLPYLEANNLIRAIQSGFRKGHSTETLLLRLLSDIYGAIDRSQLTLLALFDVGAAFDTVDHGILLERFRMSCGVTGAFLCWRESFLGSALSV